MKQGQVDNAAAAAAMGAALFKSGFMVEDARAVGIYHAINSGPLEHLRSEHAQMHDRLAYLRGNHPRPDLVIADRLARGLNDITPQFFKTREMEQLERDMAAIPFEEKWRGDAPNVVCTIGKDLVLDTVFAGSGYTTVGPFMGLISSVSYSAVAAGDTSASHAGWTEAGAASNFPLYTTPRKTCVWSASSAGSKALSAALTFPIITTGGTVKGCAIWTGTGAVSTIADTNGTLYSAGLFTGGDKVVAVSDSLAVSYSTSL